MTNQQLLSIAIDLDQRGLEDEAELAYQKVKGADTASALALARLGSLALKRGDAKAASIYFQSSAEIEADPGTLSRLGVSLSRQGKGLLAEQAYRLALRVDPEYEEALFNLGVELSKDRPDEAQRCFRKALKIDPRYGCAHRELGYLLSKLGRGSEAEWHLRTALRLDPGDDWGYIYLGTHLWSESQIESALRLFEQAKERFPDWEVAWWSLGNILASAFGQHDEAKKCFEQALRLDPESEGALRGMKKYCASTSVK